MRPAELFPPRKAVADWARTWIYEGWKAERRLSIGAAVPCHRCGGTGRVHTYGRCFRCGGACRDPEQPRGAKSKRLAAGRYSSRCNRIARALLASLRSDVPREQLLAILDSMAGELRGRAGDLDPPVAGLGEDHPNHAGNRGA
jgi:hypothetical protein